MKKILYTLLTILLSPHAFSQSFNHERQWATYFGGENTNVVDNAMDSSGNIYITGVVVGTIPYSNQFATADSYQSEFGGGLTDGFLAKFNPDGILQWATFYGEDGDDIVTAMYIDKDDNIYITGSTTSPNMSTEGAYQTVLHGTQDGFLAKFNVDGEQLWATYYGGYSTDIINGVDSDVANNLYIYGRTASAEGISTSGSFQDTWDNSASGSQTDFIALFTDSGSRIWSTYYGTNNSAGNSSRITGITTHGTDFYIAGFVIDTTPSGYFATPGCHQMTNSNAFGIGADLFLSKFSFNGARLWSTYYGGALVDRSVGASQIYGDLNMHTVATTSDGVYIAGLTNSPNNVATEGSFQTTKQGYSNFVAKFNHDGNRIWGTYLGNSINAPLIHASNVESVILTTTVDNEIFVSGSSYISDIASPQSYQPAVATQNNDGFVNNDSFIVKLSSDGTTREFGTYYGGYNSEQGTRSLIHDEGFYVIGTTFSNENISTVGAHQQDLNYFSSDTQLSISNAFIAKFVEIPLKIDQVSLENSAIYPVPNNGSFYVKLNEHYIGSDLIIYDLQGKIIHTQTISRNLSAINISVSDGTYILRIVHNDFRYECKLIIKN